MASSQNIENVLISLAPCQQEKLAIDTVAAVLQAHGVKIQNKIRTLLLNDVRERIKALQGAWPCMLHSLFMFGKERLAVHLTNINQQRFRVDAPYYSSIKPPIRRFSFTERTSPRDE
jgi:hypothetical protein